MGSNGESLPERTLRYALDAAFPRLRIVPYHKEDGLGRQHLDFFIPAYYIGIEVQGRQHNEPVYGEEHLRDQKERDRRKSRCCRKLGIRLFKVDDRKPRHRTIPDVLRQIERASGHRAEPIDIHEIITRAKRDAALQKQVKAPPSLRFVSAAKVQRTESPARQARRMQHRLSMIGSALSVTGGTVHLFWWLDGVRVTPSFAKAYLRREHGIALSELGAR